MKFLAFFILAAMHLIAQPKVLYPTWSAFVPEGLTVAHHASGSAISLDVGDTLVLLDALTGEFVGRVGKQGKYCVVTSYRDTATWIDPHSEGEYELTARRGPLFTDVPSELVAEERIGIKELRVWGWSCLTSSVSDKVHMIEWGDYYIGEPGDQTHTFTLERNDDGFEWSSIRTGGMWKATLSRSGRNSGGVDFDHEKNYSLVRFGGSEYGTSVIHDSLTFAWLDDIDNVMITSAGLFDASSNPARFLRPLPFGYHLLAPFADWTYAISSTADSNVVGIVNLLTDTTVAHLVPQTFTHMFSDVKQRYIVAFHTGTRALNGYVIDSALIPDQTITSVHDDESGKGRKGALGQAQLLLITDPPTQHVHIDIPLGATHVAVTSMHGEQVVHPVPSGARVIRIPVEAFAIGAYIVSTY